MKLFCVCECKMHRKRDRDREWQQTRVSEKFQISMFACSTNNKRKNNNVEHFAKEVCKNDGTFEQYRQNDINEKG